MFVGLSVGVEKGSAFRTFEAFRMIFVVAGNLFDILDRLFAFKALFPSCIKLTNDTKRLSLDFNCFIDVLEWFSAVKAREALNMTPIISKNDCLFPLAEPL